VERSHPGRTCAQESRYGSTVMKTGRMLGVPVAATCAATASVTRAILTSSLGQMSGQYVNPKYSR
jgi:hypothetical protein